MAIRQARINFDGAARHESGKLNTHAEQAFRALHERLLILEQGQTVEGLNPDQQRKIAPAPPRAKFLVDGGAGTGLFAVKITNPEFIPGRKGDNPLRTPIFHKLKYSTDPTFRSRVTELPPSTQTYWPINGSPGQTLHFRVLSSYDGHTWNSPTDSGAITA